MELFKAGALGTAVSRNLFYLGFIAQSAILIGVYVLSFKIRHGILLRRKSCPPASNPLAGKVQPSPEKSQVLF